jgi:hypothetical protein
MWCGTLPSGRLEWNRKEDGDIGDTAMEIRGVWNKCSSTID